MSIIKWNMYVWNKKLHSKKTYSFAYIQTSTFLINSNTLNFIVLFGVILSAIFFRRCSVHFQLFVLFASSFHQDIHYIVGSWHVYYIMRWQCRIQNGNNVDDELLYCIRIDKYDTCSITQWWYDWWNNYNAYIHTILKIPRSSSLWCVFCWASVGSNNEQATKKRAKYPALVCINYNNQRWKGEQSKYVLVKMKIPFSSTLFEQRSHRTETHVIWKQRHVTATFLVLVQTAVLIFFTLHQHTISYFVQKIL